MIPIRNPKPVRLEIHSRGAAPKKTFGTGAYKFFSDAGVLLVPRGWIKLKQTRDYVFLRPPADGPQKPPFVIDVDLPSREEVLELAEQRHAAGAEWSDRLGEWWATYIPSQESRMFLIDDKTNAPAIEQPYGPILTPARFNVGIMLIWNCWVDWENGTARYGESAFNIRGQATARIGDLFADVDEQKENTPDDSERFEGTVRRVERNEYERDAKARRRCIAHHGACCAACGLEFGRAYGAVADGFIHVHHLVPISARGGEYKVDPVNDLVPICPNCHAVMHMSDPPLAVAEIRDLLKANRSGWTDTASSAETKDRP